MDGACDDVSGDGDITEGGRKCIVCFESFVTRRRTVHDGASERVRVKPFLCAHDLCAVCDEALKERGNGRCPVCREERQESLPNDTREQASADDTVPLWGEWAPHASAILALTSSLAHRRFVQMELQQRRDAEEQEELDRRAEVGAFDGASEAGRPTRRPRAGGGRGTFTQIRQEDQDLIGHLLDPVNTSVRRFAALMRAPPEGMQIRVVRFRPHNP